MQTEDNCVVCNKDWLNYYSVTTIATCTDSGIGTDVCASKIDNCYQNVCYFDNSAYYRSCKICSKNYTGSGVWQNGGYPACGTDNTIGNCEYHYLVSATGTCYSCKADYAVASTGTSCVSFTSDPNCRTLNSSS